MSAEAAALYAARRARVLDALGERAAMIVPAAPELRVGWDMELRYRPDPDLYYLTGYPEPEAVLVLHPERGAGRYTLFVRPRDAEQEVWTGARGGPEAAREVFGADSAFPITELSQRLPRLVAMADTLYFRFGTGRDGVERLVRETVVRGRRTRQRSGQGPRALVDPGAILDEMRLIKDGHELALLREAARISVEGFREAILAIRPGAGEWEVEAALDAAFRRRGADDVAFPSIVASGANAAVLHYIENRAALAAGALLLVDAGARFRMYNGDISRTFPVSGRFTPEQRALYDAVLAAKEAATAAVRPGVQLREVHHAALRVLLAALLDRGLIEGDLEALLTAAAEQDERESSGERQENDEPWAGADGENEAKGYKRFFPHGTSHWLGLDVHDVGDRAVDGEPRRLAPGMVLTVEPGLYIPPTCDAAPAELRGVGIRIEDDVVVTADGHDVLTAELPAAADAIEALMAGN